VLTPTLVDDWSAAFGSGVRLDPFGPGDGLPVFIHPVDNKLATDLDAASRWLAKRQQTIDEVLSQCGAIVFRGFPIHDSLAFGTFLAHLPSLPHGYVGGNSSRSVIQGRVYETTTMPSTEKIALHQEAAYLREFPSQVAFFCMKPADVGGETILCDMRTVAAAIPADLCDEIERRGVRYVRNFRSPDSSTGIERLDAYHKPWTEAFYTTSRDAATSSCAEMGMDYQWGADGSLTLIQNMPGFVTHPVSGERLWFNHVHAMSLLPGCITQDHFEEQEEFYSSSEMTKPYQVFFGDGGEMDPEAISTIYPILDAATVAFPWMHSDVMLVDNLTTAHGRNPFSGTRDTQVLLVK
jgi:alpha-ketoglutarate-dependent taurine dioxygenase